MRINDNINYLETPSARNIAKTSNPLAQMKIPFHCSSKFLLFRLSNTIIFFIDSNAIITTATVTM